MAKRKTTNLANQGPFGGIGQTGSTSGQGKGGGGFGTTQPGTKTATGQPLVNPFLIPKQSGQNIGSWVYPSQYLRPWDVSLVREACDQAIKMGYTQQYATLTSWVYEKSPFVQSLFLKLGAAMDRVPFYIVDKKGEEIPELTEALCNQQWQIKLRREILYSYFWGFSILNFDPIEGKCYKYPMQQIDPINRMLKANTFSFYDGAQVDEYPNLLFIQPSDNYEAFLGWMEPISFAYVEMNENNDNWVAAGRRSAYSQTVVYYPQDDGSLDPITGLPRNDYKQQAIEISTNMNPKVGLVAPYTLNDKNEMQKSIVLESEKNNNSAQAYKIYTEFNQEYKSDIQTLVFGRSLTGGSSGKGGNRALGEIEERTLDDRVAELMPYVLAILNNEFKGKISQLYSNLPNSDNWSYSYNKSKQLTIADLQVLVSALNNGGYRPTPGFYEKNGVSPDDFEPMPQPKTDTLVKPDATFQMAAKSTTLSMSTIKSLVGKSGYEGYSARELADYYKSIGYKIN
jgi:hypothetical protein